MSSRAPRVLAPRGASMPSWLPLRWFRKDRASPESPQAQCFAAAAAYEEQHRVRVSIIKWDRFSFSFIPEGYFDVLYDMLDLCRLPHTSGHPEYYLLVLADRPHQFCLDIEMPMPHGMVTADEFMQRVEGSVELYERFIQEYHQHMCSVRAYVVCGSRDKDAALYKHSYHVLLRCDKRCCFRDYAHWSEFAQQFCAYIKHPDVRAANPWLYHDDKCIIDDGIYTTHRAMRLPRSAKSADGVPMAYCPLPGTSRFAVPDVQHNDIKYHLHGWIEPGPMVEFAMVEHERVVERLPRLRNRPVHRPLPVPQDDECTEHIRNILEVLAPGQTMYAPETMTISSGASWARTLSTLLRLEFSDLARGILYDYMNWWRVCCLIARYVGPNREGEALWKYYAQNKMPHAASRNARGEITQYESGERQWRSATLGLNQKQPPTIHGFNRDMQWLGDILNVEWQAYVTEDAVDYPCLASSERHSTIKGHIDREMFVEDGSIMVYCDKCRRHIFCGYMVEKGAMISNTRYVGDNEHFRRMLVAAVRTQSAQQRKRTLAVVAAMGAGKSTVLQELRELAPGKSVLVLSVRRLLSEDLYARLLRHIPDMKHYIRCRQTVATEKRLVIQLDSLHKLQQNRQVNKYDVVILEEIRSLLAHLSSSTLEKRRRVICQMLMYIISEARVVIALDADMDPCSYQFLRSLRHDSTFDILRNLSTPCARTHLVIKWVTTWYTYLRDFLQAGKKIFLVSNCKRRIDGVYKQYCEQYRCLIYTSKTPQQQKLSVSDCNRLWLSYDMVLVSPVVSAGLNFSEVYFDVIMSYLKAGSACARESCQQEGRVRTMTGEQVVYTYIDNRIERENLDCVATPQGCLEYINQGLAANFELAAPFIHMVEDVDFSNGRLGLTPDNPVDQVFLENMAEGMRSLQNYYQAYKKQCLKHGDQVRYIATDLDAEVSLQEINDHAQGADDDDSMSLSQSLRPGDAGQAMDDMQSGEHEVDPNSLQQEHWCHILKLRHRIDDLRVWDVVKRSGFLSRFLVCMLALHPTPHEVRRYLSASMILPRIGQPEDQLALFLRETVAPYERMLGGYDRAIQRADLVRSMIEAVFGDVDQTARNVEDPVRAWVATGDNLRYAQVECPTVKWTAINRANARAAVRAVCALADLDVKSERGGAMFFEQDRLNIMFTLSHLACRNVFQPRGAILPSELSE